MSLQALVWAIYDIGPNLKDASAYRVLIVLADHADDRQGAYPSRNSLAEKTGLSARTVGYKLDVLEQAGIIRRGNQSIAECLPANKRTIVWDLAMNGTENARGAEFAPQNGLAVQQVCNVFAYKPVNPLKPIKPLTTTVSQSAYVSSENKKTDRPTGKKKPTINADTKRKCQDLRIDTDDEWTKLLDHVNASGQQPRDWQRVYDAWLKQAIQYRQRHPTKDPRTDAQWCRIRDTINNANGHNLTAQQISTLHKTFWKGKQTPQQATQNTIQTAQPLGLHT